MSRIGRAFLDFIDLPSSGTLKAEYLKVNVVYICSEINEELNSPRSILPEEVEMLVSKIMDGQF